MKKLILIAGLLVSLVTSAKADSQSFVIGANTITNIFPGPMKITSLSILATNAVTLSIYDAPGIVFTNNVNAYSNLTQYATNVSVIYTNYYGVLTTNWLTNALVTSTQSVAGRSITYPLIFTQSVSSNTTAIIPNLSMTFLYGVMVTNNSGNTVTLTPTYTGN